MTSLTTRPKEISSLCKRLRVASQNGTGLALSSGDVDILRRRGILRHILEIEIDEIEGVAPWHNETKLDAIGCGSDVIPANGPYAGTNNQQIAESRGGVALAFDALTNLKNLPKQRLQR